jgi:hypothetical protein
LRPEQKRPCVGTGRAGPGDDKIRPGKFDPGAGSIKSPVVNAGSKNFAGARRGAVEIGIRP